MRNIDELPENDIPDSLWLTLHHSHDVDNADINRTGYVDNDFATESDMMNTQSNSTVIPMMFSGVVDVNCSDLSTSDIRTNLSSRYRSDGVHRNDDTRSMSCESC